MNILEQAEADLSETLEDIDNGFGVALVLNDGANDYSIAGQCADIGYFMDPETGIGVAGRTVEITVRISTLTGLGGGEPAKSWTCQYTDVRGVTYSARVKIVRPDRTLGVYNIVIEGMA